MSTPWLSPEQKDFILQDKGDVLKSPHFLNKNLRFIYKSI